MEASSMGKRFQLVQNRPLENCSLLFDSKDIKVFLIPIFFDAESKSDFFVAFSLSSYRVFNYGLSFLKKTLIALE